MTRILLIAGSARQGALSVRLRDAARAELDAAGASTDVLDLRALAMPVCDGDIESNEGPPPGALALRDALRGADALLFVTPEYNGFPTPLAFNAFDWLSRVPAAGDAPRGMAVLADKPLALLSASPGAAGGLRSLNLMRQFLGGTFGMLVLPQQLAVAQANAAFDDAGALRDERQRQSLADIARRLVALAQRQR